MNNNKKIYLIFGLILLLIIICIILYFLLRSKPQPIINNNEEEDKYNSKDSGIDYITSEEFKNNLLNKVGDLNSADAKNSSLAGPVGATPIIQSTIDLKSDNDLTPMELSTKYTYPELVSKFGEDKLKKMYNEAQISYFKEIPNKHNFPKTKFMIKHDSDKPLCLDDRGTVDPGQFKLNFSTCDTNNKNQQFIYEPYRKYIMSANKNLCLDNGDDNTNYLPNQLSGRQYNISLQKCDPNSYRQRFNYVPGYKTIQNADRPEWNLTNPGFNDLYGKNIAYSKEYNVTIHPKQKMIFTEI
jgi:hypothetical protein